MNLLLVERDEIERDPVRGGRVLLADRRAEHLLKVLRVEPGRELRAGVVGGAVGRAEVVEVGTGTVDVRVEVADHPAPRPAVDLVVGLPRPQVLHRVLQFAAAMGVGRLDLVNAWRVEKSFFSSPSLADATVRRHLLLGAEQGQTTWVPEVGIHPRLVPFLDGLDAAPPGALRWLAHPDAPDVETVYSGPADAHVTLAIGPEGGWIDREVETFVESGFRPVRLGPWTLRVETALAASLAQLEILRRLARRT